jgi:hypothetical protein
MRHPHKLKNGVFNLLSKEDGQEGVSLARPRSSSVDSLPRSFPLVLWFGFIRRLWNDGATKF